MYKIHVQRARPCTYSWPAAQHAHNVSLTFLQFQSNIIIVLQQKWLYPFTFKSVSTRNKDTKTKRYIKRSKIFIYLYIQYIYFIYIYMTHIFRKGLYLYIKWKRKGNKRSVITSAALYQRRQIAWTSNNCFVITEKEKDKRRKERLFLCDLFLIFSRRQRLIKVNAPLFFII